MRELTMKQRQAATRVTARKYQRASKEEKGRILSTLVKQTKRNRVYAVWLLRSWEQKTWFTIDGQPVRLVVGASRKRPILHRSRLYGSTVAEAVRKIWYQFDFMCGKRLAVVLRTTVDTLIEIGELKVSSACGAFSGEGGAWRTPPHLPKGGGFRRVLRRIVWIDFQVRQRPLFR